MNLLGPDAPLVIAHRGASGYHPEHTKSAYRVAIEHGVDAVEPDLVASRDGVLVIRHENEMSKSTDVAERPEFADRRTTKSIDGVSRTGWFTEDFTWAELSTLRATEPLPGIRFASMVHSGTEPIIRLEDLLALLDEQKRQVGAVLEIKHASYFAGIGLPLDELLADALEAAGWTSDPRLTIESFELTFFDRLRERGVGGRFIYLVKSTGVPFDRSHASYASSLTDEGLRELRRHVDGISVSKKLLLQSDEAGVVSSTDLVQRAHAAGLLIYGWTLRAENQFLHQGHRTGGAASDHGDWPTEFRLILASGINGVFSDHPDLALEVRKHLAAPA
ncbi:MAG: glycerophosphodiester phosphodiesterase [Microbacteriaceae bacterium]|nr:glycerophosphodiester phosphodiesterase [Microbacteriaceae bacterium]